MDCVILQGRVSTLFRWGGHIFSRVFVTFLSAYSSAKIIKIECVLPELWSQMYCHVFFRSTVYSQLAWSEGWRQPGAHSAVLIHYRVADVVDGLLYIRQRRRHSLRVWLTSLNKIWQATSTVGLFARIIDWPLLLKYNTTMAAHSIWWRPVGS